MDSKSSIQGHGLDAPDTAQSTADLTAFVQNLLQQWYDVFPHSTTFKRDWVNEFDPLERMPQSRFQTMSDSIISKIDEMGTRIEDLEKSIGDLVKEVGVEPGSPSTNQGLTDSSKSDITSA